MCGRIRACLMLLRGAMALFLLFDTVAAVSGQEAQWIWTPEQKPEAVPPGAACHFRKTFVVKNPEGGVIAIAADDQFELFVNGRKIGGGDSRRKLTEFDIGKVLISGANLVAVKVTNRSGKTAALVARVTVMDKRGGWVSHSTDASWKSQTHPLPLWNTPLYNDNGWNKSAVYGPLGETAPWDRPEKESTPATAAPPAQNTVATNPNAQKEQAAGGGVAPAPITRSERFDSKEEFEVQQVVASELTGSLIAMTFDEFGRILASQEGGPLLLMFDTNNDRIPDKVKTYCDKVKNCQGILALNGDVFVTADGPSGPALYRLSDKDRDGVLEDVRALIKFKCEISEHGAHGLVFGPDGLIYVLLGNCGAVDGVYDPSSPHRDFYEGDLVQPRYEDPAGHAVGVKAPGGVILRTDADGSGVQLIAGGLRNPYDLAFSREGELFVHDADMESDEGLSWYCPTRLLHIIPGGEYGWRSGWARFADYFVDNLPAVVDTGRGSPTGIVAYNHFMYPARYHNCLFTADWSQGKIMAVTMKKNGASFTAASEVFVEGNPLNVTDLDVGPDGWLYFVTGGRGTGGGVYRVVWKGQVPPEVANIGAGLTAVIRQPQLQSAWSRQNITVLKKQLGDKWDANLMGVARSAANPPQYRVQALDLMHLFGPTPKPELLISLSRQQNELVRAKAAELMGLHPSSATQQRLAEMLEDTDKFVRRKACEALSRADQAPVLDNLKKLLTSDDRFEAWSARRLLERMKLEDWKGELLGSSDNRLLIEGALALVIAYPDRQNSLDVLAKIAGAMDKFVSDRDFVDLLRLAQVAIVRGDIKPEDAPGLKRKLRDEFPAGESYMNREMARLLTFLQESSITERYLEYLRSDAEEVDKLHLAIYLRFLEEGWTSDQRLELLKYYEASQKRKGGGSYARYIVHATRDFAKGLSEQESRRVLAQGEQMPNAALGALYRLPEKLDAESLTALIELDQRLKDKEGDSIQRLKVGIVAVLARCKTDETFKYLRTIWEQDPERRPAVAIGLAQSPKGDNWSYLVRSLPFLEHAAAREVCVKLMQVEQAPEEVEPYRNLILLGLKARQKDKGADAPLALLSYWTNEELAEDQSEDKQLLAWQKWFAKTYPDQPEPKLPVAKENSKYTYEQLLTYLASEEAGKASAARGGAVFTKAQCVKCHRFGDQGESVGPDLTTAFSRFTKKEVLESIVYPSAVISSQYTAKIIKTVDGKVLTGLITPGQAGEVIVLQANGEKTSVKQSEIESSKPSRVSSMPEGALEPLTLEEIADLFAYLQGAPKAALTRKPGGETIK